MQDRFNRKSLHKRNFNQKTQFRVFLAVGSVWVKSNQPVAPQRGWSPLAFTGVHVPLETQERLHPGGPRGSLEQGLEGSREGAALSSHHNVPVKFFTCKIPTDLVNDECQKKAARGKGCMGGCFALPRSPRESCHPAWWEGEAGVGRRAGPDAKATSGGRLESNAPASHWSECQHGMERARVLPCH